MKSKPWLFLLVFMMTTVSYAQDNAPQSVLPDCQKSPPANSQQSNVWETVLQSAQEHDRERYDYALEQGVQIIPTADGRTYGLLWLPESQNAEPPPMIVTLHGHASYAVDEFFLWHEYAVERGYGIYALQWWAGLDPDHDLQDEYLLPHQMYPMMTQILCDVGARPGTALLHGFSRGSANIYGVEVFDRHTGNNFFAAIIANAGSSETDFPPTQEIDNGTFGAQPFADTHWILVCGGKDPAPDRSGCPAMQRTQTWLEGYGATIDLFIQDEQADHGVFHRNPQHVNEALDVFANLQDHFLITR